MSKEFVATRKLSEGVALALAVVVSLAAINSYGDSKSEEFIVYDIEASLKRAYEDLTEEAFVLETEEDQLEVINIYNSQYELIKTVEVFADDIIQDDEAQKMINKAEYLSSYGNISIYKILE